MAEPILPGFESVTTNVNVGERAYALGIMSSELEPDLCEGDRAVFDPDGGRAIRNEIAAVWFAGEEEPRVLRMAMAMPPVDFRPSDELEPWLVFQTTKGPRSVPMTKIQRIDRLVDVVRERQHG